MPESTIPAISTEFQPFILGVLTKGYGHGIWEVKCPKCGDLRHLRTYKVKCSGRIIGSENLCPACAAIASRRQVEVKCPVCGKSRMMKMCVAKLRLSSLCGLCSSRKNETRDTIPGHSRKTSNGYVIVLGMSGHPLARKRKSHVLEHWLTLYEQHPMGPEQVLWFRNHGFSVHHKNGVRDDNRLENLELRARGKHPNGWSIEDMEEAIRHYRNGETANAVTHPPSL